MATNKNISNWFGLKTPDITTAGTFAKTNMNEVVFQKGLSEHLKEHLDD